MTPGYFYIYRIDYQFSIDYPTTSGRYYWINTFYLLSNYATPFSDPAYNVLVTATLDLQLDICLRDAIRTQTIYPAYDDWGIFTHPNYGHMSSDGNYSLINAAYISARCDDGSRSYKRLRSPLPNTYIEGNKIAPAYKALIETYYSGALITAPFCNVQGQKIESYDVSPDLHMWQLRHGTNRSARPVIV